MKRQAAVGRSGNRLPSHVVDGWTQAATRDDDLCPTESDTNSICDTFFVIANGSHEVEIHTQVTQSAGDENRVGIGQISK